MKEERVALASPWIKVFTTATEPYFRQPRCRTAGNNLETTSTVVHSNFDR